MKLLNICFYVTGASSILSHHDDFEKKYQSTYKNIASFLYEHPESCFSLSLSGPLVSWINREHSEFTQLLSKLSLLFITFYFCIQNTLNYPPSIFKTKK